ncbi:MAG TPA: hypothetical protein VGK67_25340 [Myxococcales bacterium]|jgi:ferric-dicitrate binding protein FerR (iron transport regulator)
MTTDDDRLDLSALDPTRDALRFERMARSLAAKAVEQHSPQADPLSFAVRWWRPALALAASLALLAWAPSLLGASPSSSSSQATAADPSTTLLSWASGEGPSSAVDVLATFGRTP